MIAKIIAMPKELMAFRKYYDDYPYPPFCFLSGIGKVNAAMRATRIIDTFGHKLEGIISVGVAASLLPGINVGDSLVFNKFAYHDVYCGDGLPRGQIQGEPMFFEFGRTPDSSPGYIVSGDSFIEKESLTPNSGAYAVDMESAAIAHVCQKLGVKNYVSVRAISDKIVGESDITYSDFWNKGYSEKAFKILSERVKTIESLWRK